MKLMKKASEFSLNKLDSYTHEFISNQKKHDIFRSGSSAARNFHGRIRHRDFLDSAVHYL
jgi:hypothetical protein